MKGSGPSAGRVPCEMLATVFVIRRCREWRRSVALLTFSGSSRVLYVQRRTLAAVRCGRESEVEDRKVRRSTWARDDSGRSEIVFTMLPAGLCRRQSGRLFRGKNDVWRMETCDGLIGDCANPVARLARRKQCTVEQRARLYGSKR